MNIFKSLLFLEGYLTDTSSFAEEFGPSFGNKIASERTFRDGFTQPEFARRDEPVDVCSPAGCG